MTGRIEAARQRAANVKRRLSVFAAAGFVALFGLAAASHGELKKTFKGSKTEQAAEVGKLLAAAGKKAGVESVVFDRGGYLYHGRVKALADGAREGGLKF